LDELSLTGDKNGAFQPGRCGKTRIFRRFHLQVLDP
jgi:hypothetical protein